MRTKQFILTCLLLTVVAVTASAQVDKRDVRRGNRDYKKGNYKEAEIEYRKAIVKDSLSIAANYNLAADLFRQNNSKAAQEVLDKIKEEAALSVYGAEYFFNLGDMAIANQDWQTAVEAFQESLLRNPVDLEAKENYIYAKKKLEQQQQQQQNDQNQDNQDNKDNRNDQNQDNQNDQNQNDQDKKDDQGNQNEDQQNKDQNQDNQEKNKEQEQNNGQQPKITPQAAQQLLQAIQAKEKETQDKVQKEKAQALQSRQKERNW